MHHHESHSSSLLNHGQPEPQRQMSHIVDCESVAHLKAAYHISGMSESRAAPF